jgi:hypothetical protein
MYDIAPQNRTLDSVLECLAMFAITNDLHRIANSFYQFTEDELHIMNGFLRLEGKTKFIGGHVFTDKPGGKTGLIRLEDAQGCNPKWDFSDDGVDMQPLF